MPTNPRRRPPARRSRAHWGRLAAGALTLVLGVQWLARAGAGAAPPLTPPPVPTTGAYLGAWVDPSPPATGGASAAEEVAQIGELESAIGRPLAIAHIFEKWSPEVANSELAGVAATGAIPLVDWKCGAPDIQVAQASPYPNKINNPAWQAELNDYNTIRDYASRLQAYGAPVFLRWFWEFNILGSHADADCLTKDVPMVHNLQYKEFIAAWQRIYDIFENVPFYVDPNTHQLTPSGVQASNVSFVWCPGVAGSQPVLPLMYPGDSYVDWICVDGYDRSGLPGDAFASDFQAFYTKWSNHTSPQTHGPMPIMIGETGALAADQPDYLRGLGQVVARDTDIKAVVYFDGTSGAGTRWTLSGPGIASFQALGAQPWFSPLG